MASPLPEPFQLIDILGDGEILTCRAELRDEEVLVHVLPADPAGRDRVFARIARLPRSSYFLDRIEHQGHSLVVTRSVPELEDFEGWLDEMVPEPGAGAPREEEPSGDATRLVLNIREHVQGKPREERDDAPPAEPEQAAEGSSAEPAARRPLPADRPTPPMMSGHVGVPEAWGPADDEDEDDSEGDDEREESTGAGAAFSPEGAGAGGDPDATREVPAMGRKWDAARDSEPAGDDEPTAGHPAFEAEPPASPPAPSRPSVTDDPATVSQPPAPADRAAPSHPPDPAEPPSESHPPAVTDPATLEPTEAPRLSDRREVGTGGGRGAAPAAEVPRSSRGAEDDAPRRTQLFLSMVPPGGGGGGSGGDPDRSAGEPTEEHRPRSARAAEARTDPVDSPAAHSAASSSRPPGSRASPSSPGDSSGIEPLQLALGGALVVVAVVLLLLVFL